jgi:predicted nucleotidyltransferase component of viral defense system
VISAQYRAQVDLLLQVLPHVAKEESFALKGGTAINLFVRDLPRLSVDIDLTYLPFDDRQKALANIAAALQRIQSRLQRALAGSPATLSALEDSPEAKLTCQYNGVTVKVEVNTTMRGYALEPRQMDVVDAVEAEFQRFASIKVVSEGELFGGKICAALDRQHPRDLFDVHHMLDNETLNDEIRLGLIVSLISHPRPLNELIAPNLLDQQALFTSQFAGMAFTPFSYDDYVNAWNRLVQEISSGWSEEQKEFLMSFKQGVPKWELLPLANLERLPAVRWKLQLKTKDPTKHVRQLKLLGAALAL